MGGDAADLTILDLKLVSKDVKERRSSANLKILNIPRSEHA